jgi:hypothetical protein
MLVKTNRKLPEEMQHEQRLLVERLRRAPARWEIPRI